MIELQEPRTNVAYMLLKYSEARVLSPEIVAKLWVTLFADLVKEAGLADAMNRLLDQRVEAAVKRAEDDRA